MTLWEAVHDDALTLAPEDARRLAAFRAWFAGERERAPRLGLDEVLQRAVRRTRYDLHMLALPRGARRLANVHKLLRMAADYEARHGRDVRGFIDMATAELEAEAREPDAPVDLGGLDAVRLMTIHAAKGLEFGVVVVADLGRRGNLSPPDLHVSGDRVGLRLVGLDGSRATALDFDAIEAERRAADEAEERRVMHVAMTRAEERLILSGAARLGDSWPQPGPGAAPISWIAPALVPGVAALDPGEPIRDHGLVRTVLNSPASDVLRLEAPVPVAPGEQLALAFNGGAPAAAPAVAPPPLEPAAPAPAPPATLSYSSLTRYAQCPYRFHLERGLGLPEQEPPEHLRDAPTPARSPTPRLRHSTCACAARSSTSCSRASTWAPRAAVPGRRRGPRGRPPPTRPSCPTPTWPTCRRWSPPSPAAPCASGSARRAPCTASTPSPSRWATARCSPASSTSSPTRPTAPR